MAEAHLVAMSPHNYNSTMIGLAATVHAAATMPNFLITEYFVNFEELGKEIARPPLLQKDGYVQLPTTPGLGIDLDEDALRASSVPRGPAAPHPPARERVARPPPRRAPLPTRRPGSGEAHDPEPPSAPRPG